MLSSEILPTVPMTISQYWQKTCLLLLNFTFQLISVSGTVYRVLMTYEICHHMCNQQRGGGANPCLYSLTLYGYNPRVNRVNLPERKYAAYIFDLDGTLADSMPLHYKAWRTALAEAGAPHEAFLPNEFYACGGKSATDVVAYINNEYGLQMPEKPVAERKREIYLSLLQNEGTRPIREVVDFARSLEGEYPIAIATGSALPGAIRTLKSAGIEDLFSIIVTPEDVERGKPFPDMFLLAAERLGVDPSQCVVFEDAQPGVAAAKAAGMDCIVVSTPPEYLTSEEK